MIKGARRSIIVLKTPSGKYFEQAYFIVKDDLESKNGTKKDMVKEAYKIATQALLQGEQADIESKKSAGKYFLFFALGVLICSIAATLVVLFVL